MYRARTKLLSEPCRSKVAERCGGQIDKPTNHRESMDLVFEASQSKTRPRHWSPHCTVEGKLMTAMPSMIGLLFCAGLSLQFVEVFGFVRTLNPR